jgi:polysaccharide deacetylase family protein (PEP-CTERM system associated)
VKKIFAAGHEIASHGHDHQLVYKMTPGQFRADLRKSCAILEDLTGERITGFRAPSWSVRRETLEWYYPMLEEQGLAYSSSVYPAHTFLYGIPGFPERPHRPVIAGRRVGVIEIPVPVIRLLGKSIGFSGGFYFRFFPGWLIRRAFRSRGATGIESFLYLHPREIDPCQLRLPLSLVESFIQYYGVGGCEKKLRRVLKFLAGGFVLMGDYAAAQLKTDLSE